MSKIALSGDPSGTGTFTLASPNSSTDRTLTLPDESGTVLTSGGAIDVNASAPADSVAIDSSGNVGIGTTSPGQKLDIAGNARIGGSTGQLLINASSTSQYPALLLQSGGTTRSSFFIDDTGATFPTYISANTAAPLIFRTDATERMRIDSSGNLLVGTTTVTSSGFIQTNSSSAKYAWVDRGTSTIGSPAGFFNSSGLVVGQITTSTSTTTYSTSSDYRLKENIAPMTGALDTVAQLKPCTYTWKVDGSAGQGFVAHELQEVVPDCVTGEKDAVDADGNPVYQGVDTSFLVATLTAAIQELKAINDAQASRIETLEAKVAALEAK